MLLVIRLAPSLTSLEGCTRRGGDVCVGRGGGGVSNAARRPNRGLPVVVGCLEGGGQGQREGGTAEVEGQGYGKKC